jgi:adenylate cyclase
MTQRELRLASGVVLFSYVATHLANHAVGLVSLATAEAVRLGFIAFWRSMPATLLLYAAFAVHIALAFAAIYQRRTLSMPPLEWLRLAVGFSIPLLLAGHLAGTRLAWELYGVADTYARIAWAISSSDRELYQLALVAAAWTHGCLGLHFMHRHRALYRRWFHVVFALAVLLPAAGFAGFFTMTREIAADAAVRAAIPALDDAARATIARIVDGILIAFLALLAGTLIARALRDWNDRRRGLLLTITYPQRAVQVPRGWSVLEASRAHGIAHLSLCGGRARCSTCRVQVSGADLPPPAASERRTLERIGAPPEVRLACQLRPRGDVTVRPLLSPAAQATLAEREVVILFADLRRWTGIAEKHLPYDLAYVLNEYFAAVGDAVREAGGIPNQFIGDSVMAIFGMAADLGTASRQALAAARGIEARMQALNDRLQSEFGHRLGFGIGIHAGHAAVGEVGYRDVRTLSAVGDAVNTASRLQELTRQHGVRLAVSADVARAAGLDTASSKALDLSLRGRAAPLKVYLFDA